MVFKNNPFFSKAIYTIVLCVLFAVLIVPIIIGFLIATYDTKSIGIYYQSRIGKNGKQFTIFKLKTYHPTKNSISVFGRFLRKYKLDELPQLINILQGDMTFVGPRPDISGYADELQGENLIILQVLPGLTGLASLKYRNEEYLLAQQDNSLLYNDKIIWPDKVRINTWYVQNRTIAMDSRILLYTLFPSKFNVDEYMKFYKKK